MCVYIKVRIINFLYILPSNYTKETAFLGCCCYLCLKKGTETRLLGYAPFDDYKTSQFQRSIFTAQHPVVWKCNDDVIHERLITNQSSWESRKCKLLSPEDDRKVLMLWLFRFSQKRENDTLIDCNSVKNVYIDIYYHIKAPAPPLPLPLSVKHLSKINKIKRLKDTD